MSWIKYYPISRVHNQKLSSIRQQLLRHHRVRTKVKILRSSRRAAAAAATTTVVVAVLLKYVRSMYWQVICSCFSRTNCVSFFASGSYNRKGKNKTFPQGRHENIKTGYSIGQRNNSWMIKQWTLCFQWKRRFPREPYMKYTVFSETAKKTEDKKKVFTGKKETFSSRWFQQSRQGFRSLHELPTRSWQAFLAGRGRTRKKRGRKGWETTKRRSGVFPQTDAGTQQVKSLLSHRFAPFIETSKLFCNRT